MMSFTFFNFYRDKYFSLFVLLLEQFSKVMNSVKIFIIYKYKNDKVYIFCHAK